ncbi:MAG: hypothetical protein WD020_06255, partial [Acidimicrobiia bacterium]
MSEARSPGRGSLSGRLLTAYAVVFILLIGFFGLLTLDGVESVLRSQATAALEREARAVHIGLADVPDTGLPRAADELAVAL